MARMLARDNAIGPGGVDCRYCCGAEQTKTARTREKRRWQAEAKAGTWEYKVEADLIDCECEAC